MSFVNVVNLAKGQDNNSTSDSVDTLIDKDNDLDNLNRFDEAIPYYNKVLSVNSTNFDALNGIANDLDNLERHREAITYYDQVLAIDPTNEIALNGKADDLAVLKDMK
jgi:tetratricopeptide (TPR) repeat protein